MPWILSGLALATFSVVIAVLVQRQTTPRSGEMTLTGGVPGQAPAGQIAAGGPAGMPSLDELAAMGPREAADRLFERVMREHTDLPNPPEPEDFERLALFIEMGLQAYDAVPAQEMNPDARFHVGLLRLLMGDSVAARRSAETILASEEDHLLGLLLASRAADFAGDRGVADGFRSRIREIVADAGGIPDRPEYASHRPLIERAIEGER